MSESFIPYDKSLPEIPGRCPWEPPMQHLEKDESAPNKWRVVEGRRESNLLLVPKVRAEVDAWRQGNYRGVSEVTRRLFEYWFNEDHDVSEFGGAFHYHFCQREAIETLVWLVEILGQKDVKALIEAYGTIVQKGLASKNVEFQTTMDGKRQVRRYVPEREAERLQDIPPENLRRFAFKMATGSGKTWVMAMAIVWAHFHKQRVPNSTLSDNFLIVAPNVIVYQRLEKDFQDNRIFNELPLIPPEWKSDFAQKVILRGESGEPNSSGNLFLTNIHQLYESRDQEWTPKNAVESLLGKKPAKDITLSGNRSTLERVKSLNDLIVLNDEAHHVHEENLAWYQSLNSIQQTLPEGLSLWLDFSATPKDQQGMFFPWTVCDYPLAQAVEDKIVKVPLIVTKEDDRRQPSEDPERVTKDNAAEKYGYWIQAAVRRWKEHHKVYKRSSIRPVLFIMLEKSAHADAIGKYLIDTSEFGFKESEVLIIHTDGAGEITNKDLEKAREAARDIDEPGSKIKVIVSVMMLREGWDVRNVTVALGLRPFTARANILPEQVIGRGLRLMRGLSDGTQTLEVLGTRNLLKVLVEQLEMEGVGVSVTNKPPPLPVTIMPTQERSHYDIKLPITKPSFAYDARKISNLKVDVLDAIYKREELEEPFRIRLKMKFAPTATEVHQDEITSSVLPIQEILAGITKKITDRTKLAGHFSEIYPFVQGYAETRCFGKPIDLSDGEVRSALSRVEIQEGIADYLAREISQRTVERRPIEFEQRNFFLSRTKLFRWRRNLPPFRAEKTIFNYVATYNNFERSFAEFLDRAQDVLRFASLGTTEQGDSGTQFRVDYVKSNGARGFYYPDWAVVQKTKNGEVDWIIETKGRVWKDTEIKDAAMETWCNRVNEETGSNWRYIRINQSEFAGNLQTLRELITRCTVEDIFSLRDQVKQKMTLNELKEAINEGRE